MGIFLRALTKMCNTEPLELTYSTLIRQADSACGRLAMLKLSVKTELDPRDALDRAKKHFEETGLTLVETIAHLHGRGGFIEIRVSGGKLVGKGEYDSKNVLDDLTKHVEENFGFRLITLSLHFHTPHGYVDVHVSNEKPAEIILETIEYENQVRELADKLSRDQLLV